MEPCKLSSILEKALNLLPEKNRQKYAQAISDLKIVEHDMVSTNIMYAEFIHTLVVKITDELESFAKCEQLKHKSGGVTFEQA